MNERDMNEKLPDGFKMTELGPLPEEWEVVRLGDVLQEVNRESRRIKILPDEKYKIVLTRLYAKGIQLKEIKIGKDISAEYMYQLRTGDFIFSKINLRKGAFDFVPNELNGAVVSTEHPILELNRSITNQGYIKFYMSQPSVWELFKKESKGFSGKERIKVREFLTIKIPLPPLSEQKKIAAVLSAVQSAKEKTEAVIKAAKELKKSLMKHLFTYGPVSPQDEENVPLKETEIGLIPEEWEVVRLGEFLDVIRNGNAKKQNKDGKGYPVSRIETISTGVIDPNKIGYIEGLTNEEIATYQLKEGDILFSHINSEPYLGNSAIYQNNPPILIHGMNLLVLRTKTAFLDSNFLNYLFNLYRLKGIFVRIASRAVNQSSINQGRLKSLLIPLPPLPVQQKIATILSAVDEKIKAEENKKKALEDLFKTLLHNLMTAKIRVNQLEVTS